MTWNGRPSEGAPAAAKTGKAMPADEARPQRARLGEAVGPADGGLRLARLEVDHKPQMERQIQAQDGPPDQTGREEPAGLGDAGKSEGDGRRDQNRDANQRAETQP